MVRKVEGVTITGLDNMIELLGDIAPRHANNLARSTVQAVASVAAKMAKARAPKDQGTLKKAIKAKRRRTRKGQARSDVIITKGKEEKANAWYWKFIEYGTTKHEAQPFIQPAAQEIRARMPQILEEQFKKKLIAMINREKKKMRGKK